MQRKRHNITDARLGSQRRPAALSNQCRSAIFCRSLRAGRVGLVFFQYEKRIHTFFVPNHLKLRNFQCCASRTNMYGTSPNGFGTKASVDVFGHVLYSVVTGVKPFVATHINIMRVDFCRLPVTTVRAMRRPQMAEWAPSRLPALFAYQTSQPDLRRGEQSKIHLCLQPTKSDG